MCGPPWAAYNPGMHKLILALLLPLAALVASGCDDDEAPASESAAETSSEAPSGAASAAGAAAEPAAPQPSAAQRQGSAAGIRWEAPEPFRPVEPSSSMRTAEYVFPEQPGEEPATMTVFFFGPGQGGSIDENIRRWVGQFEQPDGRPSMEAAQITERQVNGLTVHIVDVSGNYTAMTPAGARGGSQLGQRMLAAIVEAPQGPVFFKMVGAKSVVDRAQPSFEEMVGTFHRP